MAMDPDPVIKSAARWFWWIAGLSLVNAIMLSSGEKTSFVVGLAMTTLALLYLKGAAALGWAFVVVLIAFYGVMGYFAMQRRQWAFYLGLAVYAVDAALYAVYEDWMPFGFHLFAGFFIAKGLLRVRALQAAPVTAGS